jgi:hypothetical protein
VLSTPRADLVVGDRVEVKRGDGPREGESMGYATVTAMDEDGGVEIRLSRIPPRVQAWSRRQPVGLGATRETQTPH